MQLNGNSMSIKQHVDEMYAMRQDGATWDAISKHFKAHADTIRTTVLMIYPDARRQVPPSVQRPPPKAGQFRPKNLDVNRLLALRQAGMSFKAIGREVGCTGSTVYDNLKRAGYETPEPKKLKEGQPRYIRMTDEEFRAYKANGGAKWFRSVLSAQSAADAH